jgi:hypothetical protein
MNTTLEVGDSQLDLDGLLEANDRVGEINTGRTGRDRC